MLRNQRSTVGIELQDRHIRVVEVSDTEVPVILSVGEAATPPGAIQGGIIAKPEALALALRRLFEMLGIETDQAVMGLPGAACVLRTLTVPPVLDSELPGIVDGEVKHFNILASPDAVYDIFPMPKAHTGDAANSLNVLLIGAEGAGVAGIREVANRAGLQVLALEPVHVGMYRSASEVLERPSTMVVTVSETRTDVVLHSEGEICLYRDIDLGTNSLLVGFAGEDPFLSPKLLAEQPTTPGELNPSRVQIGPAHNLAIELKRSIDYFQREYSRNEPIDKLILVSTERGMEDVAPWLSNELGLPVEILNSYKCPPDREQVKAEIAPPNSVKFAAAYGLAMRASYSNRKKTPHMDLYVRERTAAVRAEKQKSVAGSLVASLLVVVAGLAVAYWFGIEANHVEHELGHVNETVTAEREIFQRNSEQALLIHQRYDLLKQSGVPLSRVIDTVASRVEGQIGLTDMQADATGLIVLGGEALDERTAIAVADSLKSDPLILASNVISFEKVDPETQKAGIKFKIQSQGNFGMQKPAGPVVQ